MSVAMACLDDGNPPFGHAGEYAIWFESHRDFHKAN